MVTNCAGVTDLVAHFLKSVPMDAVMRDLARVSAFDRYQASLGIEAAAYLVADAARSAGLEDIALDHFPADGVAHWWSFRAPMAWTPIQARFTILATSGSELTVDHAEQPFAIATYAAETPPGGVSARLVCFGDHNSQTSLRGAIAVVARTRFQCGDVIAALISKGAIGFVTDGPSIGISPGSEHRGRIELDPSCPLFGFSLTTTEFTQVVAYAGMGAEAHVEITIDRRGAMPVVTGILPGIGPEVWLTAHLCHPRPGANDNASGVAALLGTVQVLAAARRTDFAGYIQHPIRFIWAPEFVGTAALLHSQVAAGGVGLPAAVINLDMVGEDQLLCGGPFLVERGPDFRPDLLAPLAEQVMAEVFVQTGTQPGTWRPATFMGFSDHALFADPNIARPAIQFCHAPDRFNHSAADTLDKVSPLEMRRATAAAATLAQILAYDAPRQRPLLEVSLTNWCKREMATAEQVARRHESLSGGAWSRGLLRHVCASHDAMTALLAGIPPIAADAIKGPVVRGLWSGPLNVRALLADLPTGQRTALIDLIRADKSVYALLLNLAIRADGCRGREQIITETSYGWRKPIDNGLANRLIDALRDSGWVYEGPLLDQASV